MKDRESDPHSIKEKKGLVNEASRGGWRGDHVWSGFYDVAGRPKDPRRVVSIARWHSLSWLLSSCRESCSHGSGQAQKDLILSNVRVDKVAEGPGLAGTGRGWRPRWMPGGASRAAVSPAVVLDVVTHRRPRVIGSVRTSYSPMIVHSTPSCVVEYVLCIAYHILPNATGLDIR